MRSTKRSRLALCAKVSGGSAPSFNGRDAKKKRTSEYRSNDFNDQTAAMLDLIKRTTDPIKDQQSAAEGYSSRVRSLAASLEATHQLTLERLGISE